MFLMSNVSVTKWQYSEEHKKARNDMYTSRKHQVLINGTTALISGSVLMEQLSLCASKEMRILNFSLFTFN